MAIIVVRRLIVFVASSTCSVGRISAFRLSVAAHYYPPTWLIPLTSWQTPLLALLYAVHPLGLVPPGRATRSAHNRVHVPDLCQDA
jgi:hypothetical protein